MAGGPTQCEYVSGKNKILKIFQNDLDKDDVRGFIATVFGKIYEKDLLAYYFDRQRHTPKKYSTWRPAGRAWVRKLESGKTSGKRIPQDFLLESSKESGCGPTEHRLVCFEAKSWPGYKDYSLITTKNITGFLAELDKFENYITPGKYQWEVNFPGDPERHNRSVRPDAFGLLVFDYDESERDAILEKLQEKGITELESIVGFLSMILYNGGIKDKGIFSNLQRKQYLTNELFDLFLGK